MSNDEPALTERELALINETGYREALYQAWFATALEQTKSIFTLASAGVGLSATLAFGDHTKLMKSWAPVWLLLAMVAFSCASGLCIWVFKTNGRLVSCLVKVQNPDVHNALVGRLDLASRIAFGAGLVMLIFAAMAQIWL